jgi:hypothetical protein
MALQQIPHFFTPCGDGPAQVSSLAERDAMMGNGG